MSRGRWTAREYVSLNRTLTKVSPGIFFRKSPLHAAPRFASLSVPLASLPSPTVALFLSRLRPRARGQPRNRPAGKRECISRLLSFPSIFYRREKNTPKEGTVYVYYMCTSLSRVRLCACLRVACVGGYRRVSVTCDSPAHAARCTRRRFTAHYRFHTPASRSIREAEPIRRDGVERNRAGSS